MDHIERLVQVGGRALHCEEVEETARHEARQEVVAHEEAAVLAQTLR